MRQRVMRVLSRARYAAMGAAVGAAVGGLFSRNAASTGGAVGGLVGAVVGEKRVSTSGRVAELRERGLDRVEELKPAAKTQE